MPETRIPFPGFYNSWYDQEFNEMLEQEAEYIFENEKLPFPEGMHKKDIQQLLSDHSNFSVYMRYVAEEYVDAYCYWLSTELGFNVSLSYVEMTSPKEYNFETDRIFCKISRADLHAIYAHVGRKRLRLEAKKMFTSRDGFISHYSPDIDDWGPSRTWDYNQVYCLLTCLNEDDADMDFGIFEDLSEGLGKSFQAAIDWPAFEQELKFFGLNEDDNMFFPHPGITDTLKYVEKYNELNNLKG